MQPRGRPWEEGPLIRRLGARETCSPSVFPWSCSGVAEEPEVRMVQRDPDSPLSPDGGPAPGPFPSKLHTFPTHLDAQVLGCLMAGVSDFEMYGPFNPQNRHRETRRDTQSYFLAKLRNSGGKKKSMCNTVFLALNGAKSIFWHPLKSESCLVSLGTAS